MSTHELLASAVKKLGPERAQQALEAWSSPQDWFCPWDGCALARAYGRPGELRAIVEPYTGPSGFVFAVAGAALGLTKDEAETVARAFDGLDLFVSDAGKAKSELRRLLEAEAAKMTPVAHAPQSAVEVSA